MAKSEPGRPSAGSNKSGFSKEPPTKGASSRNVLSLEDVADRLRIDARHVESWIKQGILKGSIQGVQLYELEKFRAKHYSEIQKACQNPSPLPTKPAKVQKKPASKPESITANSPTKEKSSLPNPFLLVARAVKNVISATFGLNRSPKPKKVAPYVRPPEIDDDDPFITAPVIAASKTKASEATSHVSSFPANVLATANIPATAFQSPVTTGELTPPDPPSSEVWPSLEGVVQDTSKTPSWLATSVEHTPPAQHDTLIMRADQIMAQMKAMPAAKGQSQPASPPSSNNNLARELHEEKQRNQQLLLQLQDQRKVELELQDEAETLKQRLELSLTGEREVRSQLKRVRQELQNALEELEQRPPVGGADPEVQKKLQEREAQWAAEKSSLEQQCAQLDQRRALLEQQIERLRIQAEEIRQHGLQWHQLATQQDQQLRTLRQQHTEFEQEASKALNELENKVREAEAQKARAEIAAEQSQARLSQLEATASHVEAIELQTAVKHKEQKLTQVQQLNDQLQTRLNSLEAQQRSQTQRWEQELQTSAGWVQKLTDAIAVRDRRIQDLENQANQSSNRHQGQSEEELKSQIMSLKVELTSLKRNYEIVSAQAKNLEHQLHTVRQTSSRTLPATPSSADSVAAPISSTPAFSLEISGSTITSANLKTEEEEGGFRRRLKQRLGSLSSSFEGDTKKPGLEPPPFLELDIPES